jgi:hypothetical protein
MKWGTFTIFTWLLWKNYIQLSGFLGGQSMMCLTFLRPDMRSCMKDTVQSFSGGRYTWATEKGEHVEKEDKSARLQDRVRTFHHEAHVELPLAAHVHLEVASVHTLRLAVSAEAVGVDLAEMLGLTDPDCFVQGQVVIRHLVMAALLGGRVRMRAGVNSLGTRLAI